MDDEVAVEVESSNTKTFPAGLRVLVVDDDPTCLKIVETMLKASDYEVVAVGEAIDALSMLKETEGGFDLVITDVHMPNMDGFELLSHIRKEFELPVIMISFDDKVKVVTKGLECGASFYLLKPVTMNDIQNLWQYVVKKKRDDMLKIEKTGSVQEGLSFGKVLEEDIDCASSVNEDNCKQQDYKRKALKENDEEDEEDNASNIARKKARVIWNTELHNQFLEAINQLGLDKAIPKKILEVMNIRGLTRENVASHLQKYRLFLKRVKGASQSLEPGTTRTLNNGALKSSNCASGPPALTFNLEQGYPQFLEQQRQGSVLRPGFGCNSREFNAPIRTLHVGPTHFLNQEASGSNSMAQLRYGESLPMSNQKNHLQRPFLVNASSFNQYNGANYSVFGTEPHGIRMGASIRGDGSTVRGSNNTMQMVHQQPQGRLGLSGNDPLEHNFGTWSTQGQNNLPIVGNMGSFGNFNQAPYFHSTDNNHTGNLITNTGGLFGPSQNNITTTPPPLPPPPLEQHQQQQNYVGDGGGEIDNFYDLLRSSSTGEHRSFSQPFDEGDLGLIFKQTDQSADQEQCGEEFMDSIFDINAC